MEKNKKKAEMSSTMLVSVILLVISFGILILVISKLNFNTQSEYETCHLSVVERGSLLDVFNLKEAAPLSCRTKKICVRGDELIDKEKCGEFENVKSVDYANVKSNDQVEKLISEEMVTCWRMMGEGRISLYSDVSADYGIGDVSSNCVICSRIAFNEKTLEKKGVGLKDINVLNYMITHKIPGQNMSYYSYLSGDSPVKISVKDNLIIPIKNETGGIENINVDLKNIRTEEGSEADEVAILYMQISTPTKMGALKNVGWTALGVGTATFVGGGPLAWIAKKALSVCKTGYGALACAGIATIAISYQQINAELNRGVVAGYCGDVAVGENARNGCSVVRTVKYDVQDIKKYCSVIESIP
jgi:hypothetical protein